MGGTVIVGATVVGYLAAALLPRPTSPGWGFTATGLLLLFLMVGLGTVGFLDDFLKIRHRRSLGLNKTAKLVGQLVVGVAFAVLAINFPNGQGVTPASTVGLLRPGHRAVRAGLGRLRDPRVPVHRRVLQRGEPHRRPRRAGRRRLGDGVRVLRVHLVLAVHPRLRQRARSRAATPSATRSTSRWWPPPAMGACLGFLWWNTSPARIFMGDTGSLALGGLLAGLAIVTRTELLLVVLGGLFVAVTLSVVIQVAFFRATRRRVFRMAPLHHHFELAGWTENTVIVRFWLVTGDGGRVRARAVLRRLARLRRAVTVVQLQGRTVLVAGLGVAGAAAARVLLRPRRPGAAHRRRRAARSSPSSSPPAATWLGPLDDRARRHRPGRHLARLAPRRTAAGRRRRAAASRWWASRSWPGGCAAGRRRRPARRGWPSPAPTARPPRSPCSRRSCSPPAAGRSPRATSAGRWSRWSPPSTTTARPPTTCSPSSCRASSCTGRRRSRRPRPSCSTSPTTTSTGTAPSPPTATRRPAILRARAGGRRRRRRPGRRRAWSPATRTR